MQAVGEEGLCAGPSGPCSSHAGGAWLQPLLGTQHTPRETIVWQTRIRLLNNRSQISWRTTLSVCIKESDSTVMLVLRVWGSRRDGIFLWIIFYTVLAEIVVLTMFLHKPKSSV